MNQESGLFALSTARDCNLPEVSSVQGSSVGEGDCAGSKMSKGVEGRGETVIVVTHPASRVGGWGGLGQEIRRVMRCISVDGPNISDGVGPSLFYLG